MNDIIKVFLIGSGGILFMLTVLYIFFWVFFWAWV